MGQLRLELRYAEFQSDTLPLSYCPEAPLLGIEPKSQAYCPEVRRQAYVSIILQGDIWLGGFEPPFIDPQSIVVDRYTTAILNGITGI